MKSVFTFILIYLLSSSIQSQSVRLELNLIDSFTFQGIAQVKIQSDEKVYYTNAKGQALIDLNKGNNLLLLEHPFYHADSLKLYVENDTAITHMICPETHHLDSIIIVGKEQHDLLYSYKIKPLTQIKNIFDDHAGISTISMGPSIIKPSIRGFTGNRLVTMNNGVKQEGQQWGMDHGVELDPFAIGSIQIIKGASGIEYGAEAIGGVVKIEPRKYRKLHGTSIGILLNAASNNRMGAGYFYIDGKSHQHFAYKLNGSYKKAGDMKNPNYILSNTGFEEFNLGFSSQYILPKSSIECNYSIYHNNLGILSASHIGNITDLKKAISIGEPSIIQPFTYSIKKPSQWVQHQMASIKWIKNLLKKGLLIIQYSWQENHRKEFDLYKASNPNTQTKPVIDLLLWTNQLDMKWEHSFFSKSSGKMGSNSSYQSNASQSLSFIIPNFESFSQGLFWFEKFISKKWEYEAGIRYDFKRIHTYYYFNNQIKKDQLYYNSPSFSLSSSYSHNAKSKYSLTLASAWRPPSLNEMYAKGLHGATSNYEIGNRNLVGERNYNMELEIQLTPIKKIYFHINPFFNYIHHYIYLLPDTQATLTIRGAFPTMRWTQDQAFLTGCDFHMEWQINQSVQFISNISYLYGQNISKNQPLYMMPGNRISGQLNYQLKPKKHWKNTLLTFKYLMVAKQNRFQEGIDYAVPPPAYSLFHLFMESTRTIKSHQMTFKLEFYNILNKNYRDYLSRYRYFAGESGIDIQLKVICNLEYNKPLHQH